MWPMGRSLPTHSVRYQPMFNTGSSTYHNMTVRAVSGPALYDGYMGNFVPTQTHSDGNEATSNGVEVSY